ncbi:transcription elongation factor GreA [Lapidilactobacillus bayanensis]|uniref:transcription elongation factor GreA n=1 Tax=Lapidilactobacillus bayanensis TaxID=2485998 RepID=UPI000F77D30C|nr:transcription elongation factor GreA [Lapidilactobacillus bayanensis]
MADKVFPMTAEGKVKLENELNELKTVKRQQVIERIKIARGFGDLSENSEYESAKDEQSVVETRISQIEEMLHYAQVVDSSKIDPDEVSIGKQVTFVEDGEDDAETYTIVGSAESDPAVGKISNDSPIAKALLGKKKGEKVTIETPGGSFDVTITVVK